MKRKHFIIYSLIVLFVILSMNFLTSCKHVHNFETVNVVDPTCFDIGIITYKCECGETKIDGLPFLEHNLEKYAGQEPTCTQSGWSEYVACKNDGCNYSTYELLNALGHNLETHAAQNPTCTTIGWEEYIACTNAGCEYSTYEEIAPLAHNLASHDAQIPTCTEIGWKEYVTCKRDGCEYSTFEQINSLGHFFERHKGQEPTCTEIGWKEYVACERDGCGYSTYEAIAALSHLISYVNGRAPTCNTVGWNRYEECRRVGCEYTTYEEIPIIDHDYSDSVWLSTDNITMKMSCKYCDVGFEKDAPSCDHYLTTVKSIDEYDRITVGKYLKCQNCEIHFSTYDVILLTFEDLSADSYRMTISCKIATVDFYDYYLNKTQDEPEILNLSDSFTYLSTWQEKRSYIKEVYVGENVVSISDLGKFPYCNKLTISNKVNVIKTDAIKELVNLKEIYFEGDLPNLEIDALWRKKTTQTEEGYNLAPIIYYYEDANGFDEYEYKIQGCGLCKIGDETPSIPNMTMNEYAKQANSESLNLATKIFEDAKESNWYLQFIPNCSLSEYKAIKDLAISLTEGLTTDTEKARAIFNWIVDNIEYDVAAVSWTVEEVFKNKKAVCAGYAWLMQDMLSAIYIPSLYASGYSYSGTRCTVADILNDTVSEKYPNIGHAWLICNLDGEVYICDPTWDNFMISPDSLARNQIVTTEVNGLKVIPSNIDVRLYANAIYYSQNGEIYSLYNGLLTSYSGIQLTLNTVYTYEYIARSGTDYSDTGGYDYFTMYKSCNIMYSSHYVLKNLMVDASAIKYTFVNYIRLIAFNRHWYGEEIDFLYKEKFIFAKNGVAYFFDANENLTAVYIPEGVDASDLPLYVNGYYVLGVYKDS